MASPEPRRMHPNADQVRQVRRVYDLAKSGLAVLRDEIETDGAMAKALRRLDRSLDQLKSERRNFATNLEETHHSLERALDIGSALESLLSRRGIQSLASLAVAQKNLNPLVEEVGLQAARTNEFKPSTSETSSADHERRASPRVALTIAVNFTGETNFYQGFSEDISDGGLFIATYEMQPVGSIIELEFTLPNGHIVRANALVRWVRGHVEDNDVSPGLGLQFESLYPEDHKAIQRFIRLRNPLFFEH